MRVSILISDLTANGGAPRQAMLLARGLQELGHPATLYAVRYCPELCYPEIAAALDIRAVERLSPAAAAERNRGKHHGIFAGARRHLWESQSLAELVALDRCDILNAHVRGATRAAVACKQRTGTPVVWMCDDARNWEEPGYRIYYAPPVQWLFDRVMARLEKPVVSKIDRIITLDHRVKSILESYYGRPTEVIRSGLDAATFSRRAGTRAAIRARHGISDGDFLLLWLGILEPHRRIEDTLEALRWLRLDGRSAIRFLIAGSGAFAPAYVRKLQELTEYYGLQDVVRFHPQAVPESEMADYYSAADALVYLPESQCWGLGVFEALACDLPAIVSRACGAHEVLEDRRTAMLVSPRNPVELARAITELADDPALRKSIVTQARLRVLAEVTWKSYAQNMLRVFEQVLGEQRGKTATASREVFA
jgi:glycosyltransferase involved in cell wall biosynthesis